ncbi:MAG: hypothetical protein IH870_10285, partial [Chloroflexi bacterium]|nr:hypothetical protein [Chloroflexota bacterium]
VLVPGAPAALAGFTLNQQVVILGEMDDDRVGDSTTYQPVLIPGAPAALAGFTPNQQVEILGEMDDDGVGDSSSYQPVPSSNLNWKMAFGPYSSPGGCITLSLMRAMWGTKANLLDGSVWIAWAPTAVSNHSMGGPPTAPSSPRGCTAAWAPC